MLLAQTRKLSDELLTSLRECFLCADEGEVDEHLSVEIKTTDGASTLKQPELIKRAIELLALTDSNPRSAPVAKPSLGENIEGKHREEDSFHCRPEMGLFQCLAGCTMSDALMAAHQEAKLSTNPKAYNCTAVNRIG